MRSSGDRLMIPRRRKRDLARDAMNISNKYLNSCRQKAPIVIYLTIFRTIRRAITQILSSTPNTEATNLHLYKLPFFHNKPRSKKIAMFKLAVLCLLSVFALYNTLPLLTRSNEHNIYECIDPETK